MEAFDLLNSTERIIDIAMKYGYESQDAFEGAWSNGAINRLFENYPNYRPAGFLGIADGGQCPNSEEMNYIIAVTNDIDVPECKHVPVLDGMQEYTFPAATWAIFEANGEIPEATQKIYKQFYTEWLPNSGYELAGIQIVECYLQENKQEVWIAVNRK